jgi:hypothetical protein
LVELAPGAPTHGEVNARRKCHSENPKAETAKSQGEIQHGNSTRKATGQLNKLNTDAKPTEMMRPTMQEKGPNVME